MEDNKAKHCFLILHYGYSDLTINAIESILKLRCDCTVVIVDNGTSGGFVTINSKYENNNNIVILRSDKNLGFSKGNNLGFSYIKENLDVDFLTVINNDIVISNVEYCQLLEKHYHNTPFYIAGPDIYVPKEFEHTNPMHYRILSIDDMNEKIRKSQTRIERYNKHISSYVLKEYIKEKNWPINKLYFSLKNKKVNDKWMSEYRNDIVLQGSCLIFDRRFIEKNSKLFEPEVFLYCEEHFLSARCKKNGWDMVYIPEIQVLHMHRGSSNLRKLTYAQFCKRKTYMEKEMIKSQKLYIEYLQGLDDR